MTRENLVEELLKLPQDELLSVFDDVIKHLVSLKRLELAKEIIERYRPALEELASK